MSTAENILNITRIIDLLLRLGPPAVSLVKYFTERVREIPEEQLGAFYEETGEKFDAIIERGKAEIGDAPPKDNAQ